MSKKDSKGSGHLCSSLGSDSISISSHKPGDEQIEELLGCQ
jgi:hypothetical protein